MQIKPLPFPGPITKALVTDLQEAASLPANAINQSGSMQAGPSPEAGIQSLRQRLGDEIAQTIQEAADLLRELGLSDDADFVFTGKPPADPQAYLIAGAAYNARCQGTSFEAFDRLQDLAEQLNEERKE